MLRDFIKAGVLGLNGCYLQLTEADADLVAGWLDQLLEEGSEPGYVIKVLQGLEADLHNVAFIYRTDPKSLSDWDLPADFDEALKQEEEGGKIIFVNEERSGAILQL